MTSTAQLDRLELPGQLEEMQRLPPWIEALATCYRFSEDLAFAVHLCLEEAVSNVIRHSPPGAVTVSVTVSSPRLNFFLFTVEDNAPAFNPLALEPLPSIGPQATLRIGGQGIRLMRQFAQSLEYEPKPAGNRLLIGFAANG